MWLLVFFVGCSIVVALKLVVFVVIVVSILKELLLTFFPTYDCSKLLVVFFRYFKLISSIILKPELNDSLKLS